MVKILFLSWHSPIKYNAMYNWAKRSNWKQGDFGASAQALKLSHFRDIGIFHFQLWQKVQWNGGAIFFLFSISVS